MTLQQEALQAIQVIPDDKLPFLIQFARFLSSSDVPEIIQEDSAKTTAEKRSNMAGILKGKIKMADDFNDTPDCFKEYM